MAKSPESERLGDVQGLDKVVEAFEQAWQRDGQANVGDFLPAPDDGLYMTVLRELIRVDLDHGWRTGRPKSLSDYQWLFPEVFRDPQSLAEITFEEYRVRRRAGQDVSAAEYQRRYQIDASGWPPGAATSREESDARGLGASGRELADISLAYQRSLASAKTEPTATFEAWCAAHEARLEHVELFHDLRRADPKAAESFSQAMTSLPEVGDTFQSFHLLAQLGQRGFSRVFLARQSDLAKRQVVLKIATDVLGESQTLAQLQHTNIVPIYSFHHAAPFQALCMPYLGATTLSDVLGVIKGHPRIPDSGKIFVSTINQRQQSTRQTVIDEEPWQKTLTMLADMSYVESVLWLTERLAGGLAHAHERGILHRDIKPANILLTDEGEPMLLDFNLSEDTKLRGSAAAASIGGTLPYMSPEHLEAFRNAEQILDARSDLYSLGVILFELLTGRFPFPLHRDLPMKEVVARMIVDRRGQPPRLRGHNRSISPAVQAIVVHCLEPDPARRYQSARELQEDLERQLAQRPLKHVAEPSWRERAQKFRRRHPVLASTTTLSIVATFLLGAPVWALAAVQTRYARLEALEVRAASTRDLNQAKFALDKQEPERKQLQEGKEACLRFLDRYRVLAPAALAEGRVEENPTWDQQSVVSRLPSEARQELREEVGEALLAFAKAIHLEAQQEPDPSQKTKRASFGLGLTQLAERYLDHDAASRAASLQAAEFARLLGDSNQAGALEDRAARLPLRTARDHFMAAMRHADRKEFDKARPLLQEATRLDPHNFWCWFYLGNCHAEELQNAEALYCYTACLALAPGTDEAFYPFFNRGLTYLRRGQFSEACADLDHAIRLRPDRHEAHVQRGIAAKELAKGLQRLARAATPPQDREKHAALAAQRLEEAERALTRALDLNATFTWVYFVRAEVRELRNDLQGAARDREEGIRQEPGDVASWIDRGYHRAEKDPQGALADFEKALELNPRSCQALQNKASILAERLGRIEEAIAILDKAVTLYPGFTPARLGRGVLLARLGKRKEAHEDARQALAISDQAATFYQASNIYALTSRQVPEDKWQALPLMSIALRGGYGLDIVEQDDDMAPIRQDPEFQRLLQAARKLHADARRENQEEQRVKTLLGTGFDPDLESGSPRR
jgi:serine/threonine protein kinase/Tfp pilus assembly protein PilF